MVKKKPLSYAPIGIIEGEQGSGKSITGVARVVDATFENITEVVLPNKDIIKAEPVLPVKPGIAKLYFPNKEPIIGKLPAGSVAIAEDVRIYANFHLYGIRAMYLPIKLLLEFLNTGLITDGYLLIDEGYIATNAREGMTALVRLVMKLTNQVRKRHLHLYLLTPHSRQIDWQIRWAKTEHIQCSYDEITAEVSLIIKRKGEKPINVTFGTKQYRPYYDTDEQFEIPEGEILKALAKL